MTEKLQAPENGQDVRVSLQMSKDAWEKPEIVSYTPAKGAQGISYTPSDGISNLTP